MSKYLFVRLIQAINIFLVMFARLSIGCVCVFVCVCVCMCMCV